MAIAKPLVIIDGCNAINLMKCFEADKGKSFQANCARLVSIVQNFSYQSSRRYIIVFDGYSSAGRNQSHGDNLSVVYSGKKIADLVIEKMTLDRNAKLIEVVTSDNEVASICRNHGAKVIKVPEFERQIEFYGGQMDRHMAGRKGARISERENPLGETLDGESARKLAELSAELQMREMKAKSAREEEARKAKEARKAPAAPKKGVSKTIISEEDTELFTEMFAGAKRVVSKKYSSDDAPKPSSSKAAKKPAADKGRGEGKSRPREEAEFDWTKHIDESFNGRGPKR